MSSLKIKKGDHVIVLAGRDKGKHGEVMKMLPKESHTKQSAQRPDGGIISKEAQIHVTNLAIEDPKDGKPTRVGFKVLDDGRKVRVSKRSGEVIPEKK